MEDNSAKTKCASCRFWGTREQVMSHVRCCKAARADQLAEKKAKDLAEMMAAQDPYASSRRSEGKHRVTRAVQGGAPGLRKRK
jgi:hypothetical protein